jgi:hypothetical protein
VYRGECVGAAERRGCRGPGAVYCLPVWCGACSPRAGTEDSRCAVDHLRRNLHEGPRGRIHARPDRAPGESRSAADLPDAHRYGTGLGPCGELEECVGARAWHADVCGRSRCAEHVAVRDTFIRPITDRVIAVDYDSPVSYGRAQTLEHEFFTAIVFGVGVAFSVAAYAVYSRLRQNSSS